MNNSFNKKMNQKLKINLNDLSSTSSEFFLDYNKKKSIKQKGGSCSCIDMFKAISNENLELILYILKQKNCCFKCKNSEGNTLLHLLIPYYESNEELKTEIDNILNGDCSNFINIQNNEGQTPILLAVMEDNDILAEKMENVGADPSIEDINGNFVGSKVDNENSNKNSELEENTQSSENNYKPVDSESIPIQNVYNIFNIILENKKNNSLPDLTSLGINDINETESNNSNMMNLNTDDFMNDIKNKIYDSLVKEKDNKLKQDDSSSSSEYVEIPEMESSVSSMNTDKFITLLDENKNPSFFNYSDIQDTDQFISILRDKYSSQTSDKKPKVSNLNQNQNSNKITKNIKNMDSDTKTSDMDSSVNTQLIKLENETTSDSEQNDNVDITENTSQSSPINTNSVNLNNLQNHKITNQPNKTNQELSDSVGTLDSVMNNNSDTSDKIDNSNQKLNSKENIFKKNEQKSNNKNIELSTSDIDTNTLLKAIKKIQNNYDDTAKINNDSMKGGASKKKMNIMGYRNLNDDSELAFTNLKNKSSKDIDYNMLYNSDSEFGSKSNSTNELSRMMARQKETLHQEVLDMIMGMLNKGLLTQSNKPIEASERNAKLIKAYIYRQVSEKNPEMGGMDKILAIKTMSENEIINIVKKMPNLDELEESIKKHLEDKNKPKSIDTSEASDNSDNMKSESDEDNKEKKKKTTKSKTTKKTSKK